VNGRRAPGVLDGHACLAQRLDERPHRTVAGAIVAVECDRAVGERGHRRDESHDRAGQPGVDDATVQLSGSHLPVIADIVDGHAEAPQGVDHELGVAGPQRTLDA
jgi:hypothetical protein